MELDPALKALASGIGVVLDNEIVLGDTAPVELAVFAAVEMAGLIAVGLGIEAGVEVPIALETVPALLMLLLVELVGKLDVEDIGELERSVII